MTTNPGEWSRAKPLVERALKYAGGTHTAEDILDAILAKTMQLWMGERSAIVTEIMVYPQLTSCRIFLAAGQKAELRDVLRLKVEAFALEQGATRMEIIGRRGWTRVLADAGYTPASAVITKELQDV
jgi:hypothetical protein